MLLIPIWRLKFDLINTFFNKLFQTMAKPGALLVKARLTENCGNSARGTFIPV